MRELCAGEQRNEVPPSEDVESPHICSTVYPTQSPLYREVFSVVDSLRPDTCTLDSILLLGELQTRLLGGLPTSRTLAVTLLHSVKSTLWTIDVDPAGLVDFDTPSTAYEWRAQKLWSTLDNIRPVDLTWTSRLWAGETWKDGPRSFYYITMLRDPVSRYLSEWKHVQRGATWKASLHVCDGRSPTPDELPTCYMGDDWSGVTLKEFMDCSYNLANNRQVRMLADLSLVGCYNLTFMNESERNDILLQSAKKNLKNMAFYGLTEFQRKTQYLFERTFNLKFISPFTQFNTTRASNVDIDEWSRKRIRELNYLDMQLYEYAKDLFLQRFQYTRQQEHKRKREKRKEERRLLREHKALQWHKEEKSTDVTTTEDYNSQVARW
ncbi:heparan-sulfate 6-O-sulfotransferase 3-like [Rhinophrynus dorsalis]